MEELKDLENATKLLHTLSKELQDKFSGMFEEYPTFDQMIGGDVKICEVPEDLNKIMVIRKDTGDLIDIVSCETGGYGGRVDIADYAFGNKNTNIGFISLMTNNAGGDLFVVPKAFWKRINFSKYVKESGG